MKLHEIMACSVLLSGLAACNAAPPPPAPKAAPQGRVETRGIRNTDAIGYSGSAIANKVDAALDANDAQKQKMDDALAKQEQ
ncbi:MAG: hypothetical protein ACRETM_12545 [Stenotrophobium sp.]